MRNFDFRRYAPLLLLAALVIIPLAIWAATSGGSGDGDGDEETFYVERSVGLRGEPELLVTVADPEVEVTGGRSTVEVECTNAEGKSIVKGTQPWPFQIEAGYSAPHAHVAASEDEVQQARRCRVIGTNKPLVAEVQ